MANDTLTPEDRAKAQAERHARWLASLTPRDRARIRHLIRRCAPGHLDARLDNLDAPGIAAGAAPEGWETRFSGEVVQWVEVGSVKVAVLVWPK